MVHSRRAIAGPAVAVSCEHDYQHGGDTTTRTQTQ